jgi:hypothetical protein
MKYVGVDLHKHVIVICVAWRRGRRTKMVCRRRFACKDTEAIREFFAALGRFDVVVEATATAEGASRKPRKGPELLLSEPR